MTDFTITFPDGEKTPILRANTDKGQLWIEDLKPLDGHCLFTGVVRMGETGVYALDPNHSVTILYGMTTDGITYEALAR